MLRGGSLSVHGIILKGLKDFVTEEYDEETWTALHEAAGLRTRLYVPVTEYPDEIVLELVDAATDLTGLEEEALLAAFGRFLVPHLLSTYGVHVDREWTGLELIANVETYIHEALRAKQTGEFTPPELRTRRVDDRRVALAYESDRGLCALARGLLEGIADYYDEPLHIEQRRCMHEGADCCVFVVTRRRADGA
ncbi:heme-NO-binding protein [Halopiger aswanensis]|uniref:Heme-NO-binding protein n=1 Tax=Halopiger aswanensis TaxID=148449 RepID=A0A3R7KK44_9EURY|nr:heme-NO-binding protein [Halopiger aswanensis]